MEAADFPVLGFILVQECQAGLVEFLEELVPADLLQTLFLRAEIDAEDSRMSLLFGRFHRRRDAVPFLCPFLDLLMVCGGVAFAHLRVSSGRVSSMGRARFQAVDASVIGAAGVLRPSNVDRLFRFRRSPPSNSQRVAGERGSVAPDSAARMSALRFNE